DTVTSAAHPNTTSRSATGGPMLPRNTWPPSGSTARGSGRFPTARSVPSARQAPKIAGSRIGVATSSSRPSSDFGPARGRADRYRVTSRSGGMGLRVLERHRGTAPPDERHRERDSGARAKVLEQRRSRETQRERGAADPAALKIQRRHG